MKPFIIIVAFLLCMNNAHSQFLKNLQEVKNSYLQDLIFEDHPEKLKQFKSTIYYRKMMATKRLDSVRYYYGQWFNRYEGGWVAPKKKAPKKKNS